MNSQAMRREASGAMAPEVAEPSRQEPVARAIDVKDLEVTFHRAGKTIQAVNGVSFHVAKGETLVLIGESGSGKSVTLRALMRLHPERQTTQSGAIDIGGAQVLQLAKPQLRALRGKKVAMVFQEPLLALDPVYTVGQQMIECIRTHHRVGAQQAREQAIAALEAVRIPSPEKRMAAYPHEMSGGMRQRAMIALALSAQPEVLLADEPTTALDATVQIQVLILLRELQRKLGLAIVFVTHDIGAATEMADRVAVMYGGRIVEEGGIKEILHDARHPYTLALLKSRRHGMARGKPLEVIRGSPPDLANLPTGCAFAARCAQVMDRCRTGLPQQTNITRSHRVQCHLVAD